MKAKKAKKIYKRARKLVIAEYCTNCLVRPDVIPNLGCDRCSASFSFCFGYYYGQYLAMEESKKKGK